MSEKVKLAKDIHDCGDCPLYQNDCIGGWTSNGAGTPIEPPCTSWNADEEVYEGMYDYEIEYSAETLEWIAMRQAEKEKEERERREQQEKEELQKLVKSITPYGLSKIRDTSSICSAWYCNNCKQWVYPGCEHWHDGIGEAFCYKCGTTMVYCGFLE